MKLNKQENGTHFQMPSSKQVHAIASWFQGVKLTSFVNKPLYCKFTVTVDLIRKREEDRDVEV